MPPKVYFSWYLAINLTQNVQSLLYHLNPPNLNQPWFVQSRRLFILLAVCWAALPSCTYTMSVCCFPEWWMSDLWLLSGRNWGVAGDPENGPGRASPAPPSQHLTHSPSGGQPQHRPWHWNGDHNHCWRCQWQPTRMQPFCLQVCSLFLALLPQTSVQTGAHAQTYSWRLEWTFTISLPVGLLSITTLGSDSGLLPPSLHI